MPKLYTVPTGSVTASEAATKSLILVNPAAVKVTLRGIDISIQAKEALEPIRFDLYRVTTIGTPTGTATTPILTDPTDDVSQSSALTALTAEPTAVSVIDSWFVQPFGGLLSLQFPYGAEPRMAGAGARMGLRYTTAAAVKPPIAAAFWIEE